MLAYYTLMPLAQTTARNFHQNFLRPCLVVLACATSAPELLLLLFVVGQHRYGTLVLGVSVLSCLEQIVLAVHYVQIAFIGDLFALTLADNTMAPCRLVSIFCIAHLSSETILNRVLPLFVLTILRCQGALCFL